MPQFKRGRGVICRGGHTVWCTRSLVLMPYLPRWASSKEPTWQRQETRRCGFDSGWANPWQWQPSVICLEDPGDREPVLQFMGWRSLHNWATERHASLVLKPREGSSQGVEGLHAFELLCLLLSPPVLTCSRWAVLLKDRTIHRKGLGWGHAALVGFHVWGLCHFRQGRLHVPHLVDQWNGSSPAGLL